MPTTFGSAYFRDAPPKADSTMVARWRKAGLTFLGKTNSPEFAAEFVTEPRAYGKTHNPVAQCWNNAGYGFAPFSTPSNISGEPSASCPWIKNTSGLSIGVQITGKPGADLLVLQLSAQLEDLLHSKPES